MLVCMFPQGLPCNCYEHNTLHQLILNIIQHFRYGLSVENGEPMYKQKYYIHSSTLTNEGTELTFQIRHTFPQQPLHSCPSPSREQTDCMPLKICTL